MTNLPIKPPVFSGTFTGTEILPLTQNGAARRTTLADIRAFLGGSGGLTVATPAAQTVGVAFTVTGTYTNAVPAALDYSLDGGTTWSAASSPSIAGGVFTFSVTIATANSAQTIRVRDHGAQSVVALSGAFVVAAVPVESAEGATVTTVGPTIVDAALNVYSISSAGYVVTNDRPETTISANVVELYYHAPTTGAARQLYQKNSGGLWFTRPNPATAYSQTSDPTGIVIVTPAPTTYPPAAGPGPVASSSFLTVDFASGTGYFAQPYIWGVAAGAPQDNDFALCADPTYLAAMAQVMPSLYRLNSNSGGGSTGSGYWSDAIFTNGLNNPNWTGLNKFIQNGYQFISSSCRLIVGTKFSGHSVSDYVSITTQIANHIRNTNGGNGVPLKVWGFEVDNERNGDTDINTYCSYFNAAADALHAIDASYNVLGTIDDSYYPDRVTTFGNTSGSRAGAYCFHDYLYVPGVDYTGSPGGKPTDAELLASTRSANMVSGVRSTLQGTSQGGGLPIMIGEWNMEAFPASETRQQQPIAVPWTAKYMAQAFKAHVGFEMGAMWEAAYDTNYGIFQGSSSTLNPAGRLLARAGQVMGGNEVNSTLNTGNSMCLPIANGNHVGVMVINWNTGSIGGQVALNHWPLNTTGNGTITKWEGGTANPQGAVSSINVSAGLTDSISIPAYSVAILHN